MHLFQKCAWIKGAIGFMIQYVFVFESNFGVKMLSLFKACATSPAALRKPWEKCAACLGIVCITKICVTMVTKNGEKLQNGLKHDYNPALSGATQYRHNLTLKMIQSLMQLQDLGLSSCQLRLWYLEQFAQSYFLFHEIFSSSLCCNGCVLRCLEWVTPSLECGETLKSYYC